MLQLSLKLQNEQRRGPGFWKFNVNLLKDEVYIDMIREKVEQLKQEYNYIEDDSLMVDLIQSDKHQLINFSKTQACIRRETTFQLV